MNNSSAEDLIKQFKEISEGSFFSVLIVSLGSETQFVNHDALDPLSDLNALVDAGGVPIGFCRIDRKGNKLNMDLFSLEEYQDKEWACHYIEAIGKAILEGIQKDGLIIEACKTEWKYPNNH